MNTLRHPLFNLLLVTLFGVAIGAAVASHVAATHADSQTTAEAERLRSLDTYWRGVVDTQAARADACETKLATAADTADRAQFAQDFEKSWYTLLYEPALPTETADHSAVVFGMLDLVRPGLGTMLAKASPKPPQPAGAPRAQLRWVLQGYVNPVIIPDGWHVSYTRDAGHALSAANRVQ